MDLTIKVRRLNTIAAQGFRKFHKFYEYRIFSFQRPTPHVTEKAIFG